MAIAIGSDGTGTDTFPVCACPGADSERSLNANTATIARRIVLLMGACQRARYILWLAGGTRPFKRKYTAICP